MALGCFTAGVPNKIKELLEDRAADEIGSVCCCNFTGRLLGFTVQTDTAQ